MLRNAVILVVIFSLSCATGRVVVHPSDEVEMTCAAIGEDASVTYYAQYFESNLVTTAPSKKITCNGGPLVPSLLDGIGAVFKAIWTLLPWAA